MSQCRSLANSKSSFKLSGSLTSFQHSAWKKSISTPRRIYCQNLTHTVRAGRHTRRYVSVRETWEHSAKCASARVVSVYVCIRIVSEDIKSSGVCLSACHIKERYGILLAPVWQHCGECDACYVRNLNKMRGGECIRIRHIPILYLYAHRFARVYLGTSGIVKQVGGRAANSIAIKSFNLFRFSCKRRVSAAARGSKKRFLASITRERTDGGGGGGGNASRSKGHLAALIFSLALIDIAPLHLRYTAVRL